MITSNIETELLTFSQTVKKTIYISRLFRTIKLKFDKNFTIQYNNKQTIRFIDEDSVKLNTKLYYIDIYNH